MKVNHKYDVPYVAGYSADGRTIYIDRDLTKTFAYDGKRADISPTSSFTNRWRSRSSNN